MKHRTIGIWLGALLVLCLSSVGCGTSLVKPNGKLVKGGKPFALSDKGVFNVAFYKESDKAGATAYPAEMKPPHGPSFELVGKERKGVPPGKYRVSVEARDPYSADAPDMLGGQYSAQNSTLIVDVTSSDKEVIVDLDRGK
jgi:hypothetical protein